MQLLDTEVKTIEERVKARLFKMGMTIAELAVRSNISEPTIHAIFKRDDAKASQLLSMSEVLSMSVAELLGESEVVETEGIYTTGNVKSVRMNISELYVDIPFLSAKAQAGLGRIVFENCRLEHLDETYPVFLPNIVITKKHLVIEVTGESMEPGLKDGALVLAESIESGSIKYESGAVYAILFANRFVVKRIKTNDIVINNTLTVWSDNEKYGNITMHAEDIQCIWKVLMIVRQPVL